MEKNQNKPKEKKKLFSFLEQDEEVKNLGVYEKKDINDEVTKKIDPRIFHIFNIYSTFVSKVGSKL